MQNKIISALRKTLNIKKDDKVLVVTDSKKQELGRMIFQAAKKLCHSVTFMKIKISGRHGKEPTKQEAKRMLGYDVIIIITEYSLTHTDARRAASKSGARIASMPGFTKQMINSLVVDYNKMEKDSERIRKILDRARKSKKEIHITTPSGTDFSFKILGEVQSNAGKIKTKDVSNVPVGEVFLAPKDANGILVIDRFENFIKIPTTLWIAGNEIIGFQKSKEGRLLKKLLNVKGGKVIAEFGVGTNPGAKIIGNTLQDEKVKGTVHVAFGNNISMGGRNNAKIHIDILLFKPTLKIGNKVIIRNGKW